EQSWLTRIDSEPDPAAPDSWPLAKTWEDCARHVETGGVVQSGRVASPMWDDEAVGPDDYRDRVHAPGRGGYLPRRLVPIPPAPEFGEWEYPTPAPESSPDGEGEVSPREWSDARRVQWLRAELAAAETERDALAARLAAWPEVPDG